MKNQNAIHRLPLYLTATYSRPVSPASSQLLSYFVSLLYRQIVRDDIVNPFYWTPRCFTARPSRFAARGIVRGITRSEGTG